MLKAANTEDPPAEPPIVDPPAASTVDPPAGDLRRYMVPGSVWEQQSHVKVTCNRQPMSDIFRDLQMFVRFVRFVTCRSGVDQPTTYV